MTSARPVVVVSIPYYRCRSLVRRAVLSILRQSERNLVVVVTNDGDPEAPWRELDDIEDPRLVRFDLPENRGRYYADRVVLEATDAEFFAVQDADDWSRVDRIQSSVRVLREHHADAVVCAVANHHQRARNRSPSIQRFPAATRPLDAELTHIAPHHAVFRVDALRRIGSPCPGFRIAYDTLLLRLMRMTGAVEYVDSPLYERTLRQGSLTTAASTGMGSDSRRRTHATLREIHGNAWKRYQQYLEGCIDREQLWAAIRSLNDAHWHGIDRSELEEHAARLRTLIHGPIPRRPGGEAANAGERSWRQRGAAIVDRVSLGDWTVTRSTAIELVAKLDRLRPETIVEAGSGATTVLFGEYARMFGAQVLTFEHRPQSHHAVERLLRQHGLRGHVDLRLRPIVEGPHGEPAWYQGARGLDPDLAFIDGPPRSIGRLGALYALSGAGEVWLHDGGRDHEKDCLARWREDFDFTEEHSSVGKGVAYLGRIVARQKVRRAQ